MLKLYLLGIIGGAAVRMESRDVVIRILEEHADSVQLRGREKWIKDDNDWVLLEDIMNVASRKHIVASMDIVVPFARDILQSGQSPNVVHFVHRVQDSTTPLWNAVFFKQPVVVHELLLADADPNFCRKDSSPMTMCTFRGIMGWESFDSLADLLDAGATISEDDLAGAKFSVERARRPRIGHYELLAYSFNVLQACRKNEKFQLRPLEESLELASEISHIYPSVFTTDEKGQCALSYAFQYKNIANIIFCLRHGLKTLKWPRRETADGVPECSFRIRMLLRLLFPMDRIRACAMLIKSCKSFFSRCTLFRILPRDVIIKCILTPDVLGNLKIVDHILQRNKDIVMIFASLFFEIQTLHEKPQYLNGFLPRLREVLNFYAKT